MQCIHMQNESMEAWEVHKIYKNAYSNIHAIYACIYIFIDIRFYKSLTRLCQYVTHLHYVNIPPTYCTIFQGVIQLNSKFLIHSILNMSFFLFTRELDLVEASKPNLVGSILKMFGMVWSWILPTWRLGSNHA